MPKYREYRQAGIIRNELGKAVIQRLLWNATAVDCYNIKSQCCLCSLNNVESLQDKCQMAAVVKELVRLIGMPEV